MKILGAVRLIGLGFVLIITAGIKIFAAGGDLDLSFTTGVTTFGSTVTVVVVQTDGRVLVGGNFTAVNGRSSPGIVRLNADGTIDQSFSVGAGVNFSAYVNAIAVQTDGKILVGGNFYTFNGQARHYLARLNSDGSLDTGFNMGGAGIPNAFSVDAIVLQPNGKILVGGFFFDYNGVTVGNFAHLNSDGSLDTGFATNLGTGFAGNVSAIAVEPDGQIVVGGSFTNVNGTAANNIARLNGNGTLDTAFIANTGTGFSHPVYKVALQTDGRIVVGGTFITFNGTSQERLARLNTNGTLDTGFTPAVNGPIEGLLIQPNGRIVASSGQGAFGAMQERSRVARLNQSDGSLDLTFDTGGYNDTNGTFLSGLALQLDGTIFVGGNFAKFNNAVRSSLVKLNQNGSVNAPFTTVIGTSGQVNELLVLPGNKILIAGDFRGVNESFHDLIARLNADGTTDTTFNPGLSAAFGGVAYAIAVQTNGKILVVGNFNTGVMNNYGIARLNADGSIDATFNASANGTVNAIAVQPDSKILIGGIFSNVNGTLGINNIARLNSNGTLDATFNSGTGFDGTVEDLILQSNQILVGGSFTTYNGGSGVNRIARLNSNGTLDAAFTTNTGTGFDSTVYTLALQTDGRILGGGSFLTFNGVGSSGIARINSDGTRDASFNVGMGFDNSSLDFAIQRDGRILAVGYFRTYNGITATHLARLNPDGSLDDTFRSGVEVNNALNAVATHIYGRIIIGGGLRSYDDTPRSGIARILGNAVGTGAGGGCQNEFDDDFDGKADFTVYRPSNSIFYTQKSKDNSQFIFHWGINGDRPFLFNSSRFLSNEYTPKLDYGVFRPSAGYWHIGNFEGFPPMTTHISYQWGVSTDLPVPGDYDGDCLSDFAVWRPSNGVWYVARFLNPVFVHWGQNGDKPLIGDFDGDGKTDFAVFRAEGANGVWHILNSRDNSMTVIQFGFGTDSPIPADYDGDGKADIAVFRPSNGTWYYLQSGSGNSFAATQWGISTDTPVPADYDSDAVDDIAVYRDGIWYILQSSEGFKAVRWGAAQDIPMPAALHY